MTENNQANNNEHHEDINALLDTQNTMASDFNDPSFNVYDCGPGALLPMELQPGVLVGQPNAQERKMVAVFLKNIPGDISKLGATNLCEKYGKVKTVIWYPNLHYNRAMVIFATAEDAANCIREINGGVMGIHAGFAREPKDESIERNVAKFKDPIPEGMFVAINTPFTTPMNVDSFEAKTLLPMEEEVEKENYEREENDPLIEYYDQINNKILTPDLMLKHDQITNGRANYRSSTDIVTKTQKSNGVLNEITHEFVHDGTEMFGEIGDCKQCGMPTLTFCKGCKDFFCSPHCWKEYKKKNLGCSCSNPTTIKINAKLHSQNHQQGIGRGGKIKVSRSVRSPSSSLNDVSVSSTESEVDVKLAVQGKRRLQMLRQSLNSSQSSLSSIHTNGTLKRCDLPSDNKLVVITSVVDHKTVYLRSMEPKDNEKFFKFMNDVAESSKTAVKLQQRPKKGDVVLAEFEGIYYRAMVARIQESFAVVAFLEFGNLEKKPLSDLKELREDLQIVPRFTFKAHLKGVRADLKSDQCLHYLYDLIERSVALKFIKKDEKPSAKGVLCELVVSETNDSVADNIEGLNDIKADFKLTVKCEDLLESLEGENFEVTVLDNSAMSNGYVTFARSEHMESIANMQKRIAEFCKEEYEGPHTPADGQVSLAKCEDKWYRAVMAQSLGNRNPIIMFFDFGNKNVVNINNMRRMPMEFQYPRYAVEAEIADMPRKPTESELEMLKTFFAPGNKLTVIRVEERNKDDPLFIIKDFKV